MIFLGESYISGIPVINSISQEVEQTIINKCLELGIITIDAANIETAAEAIKNINNIGEIQLNIDNSYSGSYSIPSGYTTGGNILITNVTHYYYNDLKLPKLPSDSIAIYPYCWIRDNNGTGYYDLIMGTTSFYYDQSYTRLKHRGTDTDLWYRIAKNEINTATSWGNPQNHSYVGWTVDNNRTACWSNHNITVSESSSEIWLEAVEPIPIFN